MADDPTSREAASPATAVGAVDAPASTQHVAPGVDASNQLAGAALHRRIVDGVTPTWTQSNDVLMNGTLSDLDAYAFAHPDFSAHGAAGASNDTLWNLIVLARGAPGIVAGLGAFKVRDLVHAGLLEARGAALVRYARGVGGDADTTTLTPAASLDLATRYGNALAKLDAVMPGAIQKMVVLQGSNYGDCLDILMQTAGMLDGFVKYYRAVNPMMTSQDGADINAFYEFFNGTGGNVTRYVGKLKYIRNHHHFQVAELEQLVTNEADHTKSRPLTVVVHSARDWNGSFDLSPGEAELASDRHNLVITVEGSESLAAAGGRVAEVAAAYGQGGKVDQVLLVGHGESRVMEMAAKQDAKGVQTNEDIDLDDNPQQTDAFLKQVIATMSPDSPHRRIVLDACLTNSETLPAHAGGNLGSDPARARTAVTGLLQQNESLAAHVRKLVAQSGKDITTVGANASIFPSRFDDPSTGALSLTAPGDPAATADKLTYLRDGTEPAGALRALLSCWASDPNAARSAVESRVGVAPGPVAIATASGAQVKGPSWAESLIQVLYKQAIAHWDAPDVIQRLPDEAAMLAEMSFDRAVDASNAASAVPRADRAAIFTALSHSADWIANDFVKVVGLQVMADTDPQSKAAFFSLLAKSYDAQRLAPYIPIDEALTASILSGTEGPVAGRIMYAIVTLKNNNSISALQYLTPLHQTGKLPAAAVMHKLLGGFSSDSELASLLTPTPTDTATATDIALDPNIDVDGDGHDDLHVTPDARNLTSHTAVPLYDRPNDGQRVVATIAAGQQIRVCGSVGDYFAVVIAGRTRAAYALQKSIGSS